MNTKIVYVLSSNDDDLLLEQLFVSVCSLRHNTPDVFVSLVMDNKTNLSLCSPKRKYVDKYIDEKIIVDFEEGRASVWKSRWMKTNLRKLIIGDFLFIDLDTVITRDISDIDNEKDALAMVSDAHVPIEKHPFRSYVDGIYKTLEIDIADSLCYFNSGVIFCKDIAQNYVFFDKWHNYWLSFQEKGFVIDQPSLAKTNSDMNCISELHGVWNCQLRHGMNFFFEAKILHFLGKKKNCELATHDFLIKIKNADFSEAIMERIYNPQNYLLSPAGLICEEDFYFHYTDEYEQYKHLCIENKTEKERIISRLTSYKKATSGTKRLLLRIIIWLFRHV